MIRWKYGHYRRGLSTLPNPEELSVSMTALPEKKVLSLVSVRKQSKGLFFKNHTYFGHCPPMHRPPKPIFFWRKILIKKDGIFLCYRTKAFWVRSSIFRCVKNEIVRRIPPDNVAVVQQTVFIGFYFFPLFPARKKVPNQEKLPLICLIFVFFQDPSF